MKVFGIICKITKLSDIYSSHIQTYTVHNCVLLLCVSLQVLAVMWINVKRDICKALCLVCRPPYESFKAFLVLPQGGFKDQSKLLVFLPKSYFKWVLEITSVKERKRKQFYLYLKRIFFKAALRSPGCMFFFHSCSNR